MKMYNQQRAARPESPSRRPAPLAHLTRACCASSLPPPPPRPIQCRATLHCQPHSSGTCCRASSAASWGRRRRARRGGAGTRLREGGGRKRCGRRMSASVAFLVDCDLLQGRLRERRSGRRARGRADALDVRLGLLRPPVVAQRRPRRDALGRVVDEELAHEVVGERGRSAARQAAVEPLREAVLVPAERVRASGRLSNRKRIVFGAEH